MIEYITRSRDYYAAQGYPAYSWAHFEDVPFTAMSRPLAQRNLVLLTTAAPFQPELDDQGPGAAYNAEAKFFEVFKQAIDPTPDLRISHIGYDRVHCEAKDPNTWLPVSALQQAAAEGVIGQLNDQLIGIPTNRSQRKTLAQDAPNALAYCQQLGAEVALLVPT